MLTFDPRWDTESSGHPHSGLEFSTISESVMTYLWDKTSHLLVTSVLKV